MLSVYTLMRVSVYLASLSIKSPKPGVSTTVKEIRVPSSSSSSSINLISVLNIHVLVAKLTNCYWFDLDSFFYMRIAWVIRIL